MRIHLMTSDGKVLGSSRIDPPEASFKSGEPALEFPNVTMRADRAGVVMWFMITHQGKPWSMIPANQSFSVGPGDTVQAQDIMITLTPDFDEFDIESIMRTPDTNPLS